MHILKNLIWIVALQFREIDEVGDRFERVVYLMHDDAREAAGYGKAFTSLQSLFGSFKALLKRFLTWAVHWRLSGSE